MSINIGALPEIPQADVRSGTGVVANTTDSNGQPYTGRIPVSTLKSAVVGSGLFQASITLDSSLILTLNTTPVPFSLAVPAGYYARLLSADFKGTFGSAAFATNTSISIRTVGGSNALAKGTGFLAFVSSTTTAMAMQAGGPNSIDYIDSADIEAYVETGDPIKGDSTIELHITYALISI